METTYRLVAIGEQGNVGQTAASPYLAKLVPGGLSRFGGTRLGIEQTDWSEKSGRMQAYRSILIEAEDHPNQWSIGAEVSL